ncbi:putative uncharacterized protein [Firmicutes bacterium CAG:534]|nr:putative uncharacterized protein [Firmicutes bacterium CAG:534]
MFCDNLISLRKMKQMSQEQLAEAVGVSRQTISKYETGEALPDIDKCKIMAELFDVSLDDLVNYDKQASGLGIPPKGKYMFGLVKVGDKGQIVIPAKARKIFGIEPGDNLVILGDETQGLALIVERSFMKLFNNLSS